MNDVVHSSYRFREFDSFIEVARSFDWSPVQLSSGSLNLKFDVFDAGDFGAFELEFAPKIHDRTIIKDGFVSFSITFGNCHFSRMQAVPGTLAILLDERDYRSTFETNFSCIEFYCKKSVLLDHPLGHILLKNRSDQRLMTFVLDLRTAYQIRAILRELIAAPSMLLESNVREATRTAILNTFYRALAPRLGETRFLAPKVQRTELAFDALAKIEQHGSNITVDELANALGTGRRALELSFKSAIGVSPGQYLIAAKLTRARTELGKGVRKVIDIALHEGFEHHSRFSQQYARLFLEKPSETLRRAQNANIKNK